jgi:hypothetical protein
MLSSFLIKIASPPCYSTLCCTGIFCHMRQSGPPMTAHFVTPAHFVAKVTTAAYSDASAHFVAHGMAFKITDDECVRIYQVLLIKRTTKVPTMKNIASHSLYVCVSVSPSFCRTCMLHPFVCFSFCFSLAFLSVPLSVVPLSGSYSFSLCPFFISVFEFWSFAYHYLSLSLCILLCVHSLSHPLFVCDSL